MIIDCHMHIRGGGPGWPVFGTDKILRAMDSAGIDRAVLFAMCEDSIAANRRVREACACHPDRFIGFAYALPSFVYDVAAETRRAIEIAGARKVLFGTDGPEVRADVELYKVRVLKLPTEDEALILGGNIARLLGLPDS